MNPLLLLAFSFPVFVMGTKQEKQIIYKEGVMTSCAVVHTLGESCHLQGYNRVETIATKTEILFCQTEDDLKKANEELKNVIVFEVHSTNKIPDGGKVK